MQGPTKFSVKIPESVPETVRVKAKKASRIKIGGLDCIGDGMNNLPQTLSPLVQGEKDELSEVLHNLVENAIKYGGEHQIDVIVRMKDNQCLISVNDQGPGITENEQLNIFDKFYRIGNEETRTKKGSGLGLYIAKQFIELHNGNIQYKKNKPSGSIFTISIPDGK